jgi:hypothetical protein
MQRRTVAGWRQGSEGSSSGLDLTFQQGLMEAQGND